MTKPIIGILHPGAMGISVAVSAKNSGYTVYWASNGRSPQSQQRANEHNLQDAGTVANLSATCHIILSVLPTPRRRASRQRGDRPRLHGPFCGWQCHRSPTHPAH